MRNDRLDEILSGSGPLMASPLPAVEPADVRHAVQVSIQENGLHRVAAHREAVRERCGVHGSRLDDEIEALINDTIGDEI